MHDNMLDILELVALLAAYLSPHDLLACVQVNWLWNTTLIPILWHTIDDSTPSWDHILRGSGKDKDKDMDKGKSREWVLTVFYKYGRFIRNLSVSWPLVLEAVSLAAVAPRTTTAANGKGGGGDGADGWTGIESLTLAITDAHVPQVPLEHKGISQRTRGAESRRSLQQSGTGMEEDEVTQDLMSMSEPMFPEYVTVDDLSPPSLNPSLTAKGRQNRMEYGWVLTQHYWHTILSSRQTLKHLFLTRLPEPQWSLRSKDVYYRMIGQLKMLKELKEWRSYVFGSAGAWQPANIWEILRACPQIESLDISGYGQVHALDLPQEGSEEMIANTTLRSLFINKEASIYGMMSLLGLFPSLSTLRLAIISPVMKYHAIPSLNAQQPPQLEQDPLSALANLFATGSSSSSSSPFALNSLSVYLGGDPHLILTYLPNLKKLSQKGLFSKSLASALTTHCPRFEVFRWISQSWNLDTNRQEDQDATNQFFVDMSYLRVFDSAWQYIQVDEMLRQPWTCLGLEWLTCRIVGIDRLTNEEQALVNGVLSTPKELATGLWSQEEVAAIDKLHRCQRQQHGVYDQLAKLTRLKHLDLGHEPPYHMIYRSSNRSVKIEQRLFTPTGTPRLDTLELSLASGLDRLAPLKDLEIFGFQCVNHRIGKDELDWMTENWPKVDLRKDALIEQRLLALESR
ncbi:hypothetical protein BG015_000524 [Linnemannia schmuckeri]|uniref:F-box domain-containing protein n=1 Tax=Linnemannia schmuckeri TaxID=64567 RepID=A0A9P5V716_9FUNG|nr:hypothetical protein BG015_000524 [Linnemannia schmuckeri]